MKRVLLAGLLALSGVAAAEGTATKQKGVDASQVGSEVEKGWDKTKSAVGMGGSGAVNQKAAMLGNEPTFHITGDVEEARGGSISVQRPALPPAKLDIKDFTSITLDGKPVEAKYLPRGAKINARFQLDGDTPVALSIQARSAGAVGGSGQEKGYNEEESAPHERGETRPQEQYEHPQKNK